MRNAPAGVAAVIHPQTVGVAWARLAARDRATPPVRTRTGQEIGPRRTRPIRLSRWRSRAAMTQVRSMHTATAQDIQPVWPCSRAVSRMWVNEPAPAMTARTRTGPVSRSRQARCRIAPPFMRSGGDGFGQVGGDLLPGGGEVGVGVGGVFGDLFADVEGAGAVPLAVLSGGDRHSGCLGGDGAGRGERGRVEVAEGHGGGLRIVDPVADAA